jgi:hypothetical protein
MAHMSVLSYNEARQEETPPMGSTANPQSRERGQEKGKG